MSVKVITAPLVEPIALIDVEGQCLTGDLSAQADTVSGYITAIRQRVENDLRRTLLTTTLDLVLDAFPCSSTRNPFAALEIPAPPLQSVVSIIYRSIDGDMVTLGATEYVVDTDSTPGRVMPAYGKVWPATLDYPGSVRVQFVAGYGDTESVPQCIKNWMLLQIGALMENKEVLTIGQGGIIDLTTMADSLLDPERWEVRV
jgi:uncharacterized phiE125 gp8 family phage protein